MSFTSQFTLHWNEYLLESFFKPVSEGMKLFTGYMPRFAKFVVVVYRVKMYCIISKISGLDVT